MIIVTGCAGFIGSNLCIRLVEQGYQVHGIDGLSIGSNLNNLNSLLSLDKEFYFSKVDIRDEERLYKSLDIFNSNDCIIHLAAETHVDRSITKDKSFWETNVVGTSNIMRWAVKNHVRVINQITDEVYGERPDIPAQEGDLFYPTSPYPCSKMGQYYVGKSYWQTYNLPVISTFPVNCFGPRQAPEKIIPKFITHLLRGEKVPLMASTHFERDWLPVVNMCDALITLIERGQPGEDYNIGAFNHHTNIELTSKLLKLCNRDDSFIEIVPDRAAHDSRYAVTNDKIRALGWTLTESFDDYLAQTVEWYKESLHVKY